MNGRPSILLKINSICFLILLAAVQASSQVFVFKGEQKKDVISFDVVKNIVIIPVVIDGKGPFDFILDTGVSSTLITDSTIINQLDLSKWRNVNLYGYSKDKEISAKFSARLNAQIGDSYCSAMNTVAIGSDPFNLSAYLGRKISGLIGYSFFGGFAVTVNYDSKRLTFTSKKDKTFRGKKVPIEIVGFKPYLDANINAAEIGERKVKLLVDCGASHALALEKLGDSPFPTPKYNINGNLGVGIGGEISGKIGRIKSLDIGGYSFKEVLTNYPKYDSFLDSVFLKSRNGNLGSDVLRRFNITYDYQNGLMYLKKNHIYHDAFDHDMSGIEFYMEKEACFISRIEAGSPGDVIGLLPEDRIIGINFKDISNYSVDQLINVFKAKDGYAVVVEIFRNNKTIIKLLKLKRRI